MVQFDWDDEKDGSNRRKHGVNFSEASRVFADPDHITFEDNRRDYGERRANTIGSVGGAAILTVTHTSRSGIVRIISARPSSRFERRLYHAYHQQKP